jgi:hypothetical protein
MKTALYATLATLLAFNPVPSGLALAQPGSYGQDRPPGYEPGYLYGDTDVPPPEGFDASRDRRWDDSQQARDEDLRYSAAVQRWAADNCYNQRQGNQAAGAVIGGVLGAFLGSGIAGRGNRTAGAVFGGAAGAMAGSAIGASSTSPGCPPGYAVRPGAPVFIGPAFGGGYFYTEPPGYRPWVWSGGHWMYRPYPYHRYWSRNEGRGRWRGDDRDFRR